MRVLRFIGNGSRDIIPEGSYRDFRFSFRFCGVREGTPDLLDARSLVRSARIASRAAPWPFLKYGQNLLDSC
jgi:hypothetical protein